jgi:hypothetical protein
MLDRDFSNVLLEFRNHLLQAAMRDRWETLTTIIDEVHKKYGNRYTRTDALAYLHQLGEDGVHRLAQRDGAKETEFRLYVNVENVADTERYVRPKSGHNRRRGDA